MEKDRIKEGRRFRGAQAIADLTYNEHGGMTKVSVPILGMVSILGAAGAAKYALMGTLIAFFNSDTATAYVAFGDSLSVSAPTSGANGIPIPAGQYLVVAASDNYYIASAATVFAYEILDDAQLLRPSSTAR